MDNLGVSFAPTPDNAALGPRNGQLSGVPQAVQVLSLALPRVVGAKPVAPADLLHAEGGNGVDPIAAMLLQTLLRTMQGAGGGAPGGPGSLPGGTAGPNPFPGAGFPGGGQGGSTPIPRPREDGGAAPQGMPAPPMPFKAPRIVTQDDPSLSSAGPQGGGWVPGAGPYVPQGRGGRFSA